MTIKHIFVIGAGTMGNGIAQVAATSGYQVTCMDVMPPALEKAKAAIAKSTSKLLEKGTITQEGKDSADAINYVTNMDTMKDADFVIEASLRRPRALHQLEAAPCEPSHVRLKLTACSLFDNIQIFNIVEFMKVARV